MAIHYIYSGEYIRNKRFPVIAPAYYDPNSSSDALEETTKKKPSTKHLGYINLNYLDTTPFRPIDNPDLPQTCSYTIQIMLDMFKKGVQFTIINDYDVVEIFDNLDRYLISLRGNVEQGSERHVNYAKLVLRWRKEVYKHYYRYMRTNPTAFAELYPNNDPDNNIFSLLSLIGGFDRKTYETDPLRARALPPYDIEEILPQELQDTKPKEIDYYDMGRTLTGVDDKMTDAKSSWNFDDFMGGKPSC